MVGSDGFSRQNAPVEHFERVSEQLCCEGGTTRLAKDQMPYGMRVRFSPEAKLSSGGAIGRRSCLKNSFRKNCEFESHPEHHRILAQLELEQPTSNRQVIGSNPICPISGM